MQYCNQCRPKLSKKGCKVQVFNFINMQNYLIFLSNGPKHSLHAPQLNKLFPPYMLFDP